MSINQNPENTKKYDNDIRRCFIKTLPLLERQAILILYKLWYQLCCENIHVNDKTIADTYAKHGTRYLENISICPDFIEFKASLDNLPLDDLKMNYDKSLLYDKNKPLKYLKIIEEEHCKMGIFFFPPGRGAPLHDHPNMMVATKILDGQLQSHSYSLLGSEKKEQFDGVTRSNKENNMGLESSLNTKDEGCIILKTGDAVYLTPKERNIHKIKALENCAMLDIFIPNYSFRNFYSVIEDQKPNEGNNIAKLKMNVEGASFGVDILEYKAYKK